MTFNLGINVVEVDGRATPSIQAAPTSVAGFIICAPKGIPGKVEQVTNWRQFTEAFGGLTEKMYGAYAVRGFFENGGSLAYVTRIVPPATTVGTSPAVAAKFDFKKNDTDMVLTVKAGYRGQENAGTWGNELAIQIIAAADNYKLIVKYKNEAVETWENLDNAGLKGEKPATVINNDVNGSRYIIVQENGTGNPKATIDDKNNPIFQLLKDGVNAVFTDATLEAAAVAALPHFNTCNIQLLCCPETAAKGWILGAATYCSERGDCLVVGHTPLPAKNDDARNALSQAGALGKECQGDKIYGALYFPWIKVSDPNGKSTLVPPTGHILGVYARTERERGIWKAPAGNAAQLKGALAVKYDITDTEHTVMVKESSINAVRSIPGLGVVIDSSRSLSTNPLWLYVNIRLLFNFVKSSLKAGLRWVVQEPNDETLWNKVKYNSVTPFLMGLWRRGAFGPGAPEDVFTVKVDAENNTPEDVKNGILNVEVYFYPSRPAETIVIKVGQQEGGANASEA